MVLTPEEIEARLQRLDLRTKELDRLLKQGRGDQRIPLQATGFDLEDAIFSPAVRVYRTANNDTLNDTVTLLSFTHERFDTDNMHSTTSNTSRLTATTAGIYLITGNIRWASNTTGRRFLAIAFNGGSNIAHVEATQLSGSILTQNLSALYNLKAGEYVELTVYQDSTVTLAVLATGNYSPEFSMVWVAPLP